MQILSESSAVTAISLVPQPVSKRTIYLVVGTLSMITSDCVSRTKSILNSIIQISIGSFLRYQFTLLRKLSQNLIAFLGINVESTEESCKQIRKQLSDTCPLCLSGYRFCVAAACGHRFCGNLHVFSHSLFS